MIAAALVEVGHCRMTPQQLQKVLQKGERSRLPEAAPPQGLCLNEVRCAVLYFIDSSWYRAYDQGIQLCWQWC